MCFQQCPCARAGCHATLQWLTLGGKLAKHDPLKQKRAENRPLGRTHRLERAPVLGGTGELWLRLVTGRRVLIIVREGCGRTSCPEELLMQRAKDEAGMNRNVTCQRAYNPQTQLGARFVRLQNLHGSQYPLLRMSCFLEANLCWVSALCRGGDSLPDQRGIPLAWK